MEGSRGKRFWPFSRRKTEKQREICFQENGGMLLGEMLSFCNGKSTPIRNFSAKEIILATNNFDDSLIIKNDADYQLFKGSLESHIFTVKKYSEISLSFDKSETIWEIVVASQMSKHKYNLKLIGWSPEFEFPVAVFEYAGDLSLHDYLYSTGDVNLALNWQRRLRIANQIANVVLYLHTALPLTVIHRDLKPANVIIDQFGDAKLSDFSESIPIPDGETKVEDRVLGPVGFCDPEYLQTGFVSAKSDVYSFGMILLVLLTGQYAYNPEHDGNMVNCLASYVKNGSCNEVVDPRLVGGDRVGSNDMFQSFLELALKCTEENGEDRPDMIDVARELKKLEGIQKQQANNSVDTNQVVNLDAPGSSSRNREKNFFQENGEMLLEKMLWFCNGNSTPVRNFSAKEIILATNNFDDSLIIKKYDYYELFKGSLGSHLVTVKKYSEIFSSSFFDKSRGIWEIVVASQMSHKYNLKLIGWSPEFVFPVAVFEYAGDLTLHDYLYSTGDVNLALNWQRRLRTANQIANVVLYLHTALPLTVIHRDLTPDNVIIDQFGDAKLSDLSISIPIPDGETKVEDRPLGTAGFIDPEYFQTGFVSAKTDVYSFGMILLVLLTGQKAYNVDRGVDLPSYVKKYVENGSCNEVVDPRLLVGGDRVGSNDMFRSFLELALKCTLLNGEDRPDMIDVARELKKLEGIQKQQANNSIDTNQVVNLDAPSSSSTQ